MGFFNLDGEIGIAAFNAWLATRSYVESYAPSQADVACFKAIDSSPSAAQHPHAARWYKHLASYETEFSNLPGDATKPYSAYGPEVVGAVAPTPAQDDGEDVDLFGSDDEEDAQAERIRQQRLAEYKTRKATKPKTIAKSVLVLDVKPWDDETDMAALEAAIRGIDRDGLVWGTSKLVSVGYGIKKLQVNVVVEDDKVSTQDLQDEIEGFEEYVQSSDIVTFQKL